MKDFTVTNINPDPVELFRDGTEGALETLQPGQVSLQYSDPGAYKVSNVDSTDVLLAVRVAYVPGEPDRDFVTTRTGGFFLVSTSLTRGA